MEGKARQRSRWDDNQLLAFGQVREGRKEGLVKIVCPAHVEWRQFAGGRLQAEQLLAPAATRLLLSDTLLVERGCLRPSRCINPTRRVKPATQCHNTLTQGCRSQSNAAPAGGLLGHDPDEALFRQFP